MSNETDRVPLIFQSALASAPLLFIGLPAWLLVIVLQLFDIDARMEVGAVMACVLPTALFLFARLCARYRLIRVDASPVAIAVLQSAAAAFSLWLLPRLPSGFHNSVGAGGRDEGNLAGALMAGIIFAGGWVALALFSGGKERGEPLTPAPPVRPPDPRVADPRRLPP